MLLFHINYCSQSTLIFDNWGVSFIIICLVLPNSEMKELPAVILSEVTATRLIHFHRQLGNQIPTQHPPFPKKYHYLSLDYEQQNHEVSWEENNQKSNSSVASVYWRLAHTKWQRAKRNISRTHRLEVRETKTAPTFEI